MSFRKLVRKQELLTPTAAERFGDSILRPFQYFARRQVSGGLVLLVCIIIALVWANSPWAGFYQSMLHEPFGFSLGDHLLRFDLHHWINNGLMAVFFFVVGLELKREILVGELADPRQMILPIAAAVGGMIAPALIFAATNAGGEGSHGWGVPMATDIAFSLGALVLLGARIPVALKVFLVALAIVDDLGALLVIAIFYSGSIEWSGIGIAALFVAALLVANLAFVRRGLVYLVLGAGLWYGLLVSGIHPTLAGVLTAVFVPARVRIVPEALAYVIRRGADIIESRTADSRSAMDSQRFAAINVLSRSLAAANSPLQRIERNVQPWVTFAILPVFTLFNAGVAIDGGTVEHLGSTVSLGIIGGLLIGKPLGICLASWLAVKAGLARLPEQVSWPLVIGTGFLAGIGFTMALFINGLAFSSTVMESQGKIGVLVGSVLSALVGIVILLVSVREKAEAGDAVGRSRDAAD